MIISDVANPPSQSLNVLSLCAGYGGIEMGLELAGLRIGRCVYVERESYAAAILVKAIEAGELAPGVVHTNLETFPAEKFRGCFDLLVGGYPCTPFSIAGQRSGTGDKHGRHLWPYFQRAIGFVRPRLCFFENVEGHITLGFKDVCHDLGELGYELTAGVFSAAECGAPHQRKRIFILAKRKEIQAIRTEEDWVCLMCECPVFGGCECDHGEWVCADCGEYTYPFYHEFGDGCFYCGSSNVAYASGPRSAAGLSEPEHGEKGEAKITHYRGRGMWPASLGEKQYEWEHPRILGNTNSNVPPAQRGHDEKVPQVQGDKGQDKCASVSVGTSEGEGPRILESQLGFPTHGGSDSSHSTAGYMGPRRNSKQRLTMLGNGVVPPTAAKAFLTLWQQLNIDD